MLKKRAERFEDTMYYFVVDLDILCNVIYLPNAKRQLLDTL